MPHLEIERRPRARLALLTALLMTSAALAAPPDLAQTLEGLSRGPARHLFPADLRVGALEQGAKGARVVLEGAFDWEDEVTAELRLEALMGALTAAGVEGGVELLVRAPDGTLRPLTGAQGPEAISPPRALAAPTGRPRREGALSGRRVALSAGHGWINDGGWRTQRSRWAFEGCSSCRGITEDFFNAEVVARQLLPLLQNMGAEVVLVRDADLSEAPQRVVDDGDAGYSEEGVWDQGSSEGGYGGDYRALLPDQEGAATFQAGFDDLQPRRLSIHYREGGNRSSAARVEVNHLGGRSVLSVNQSLFGRFWLDLGQFIFGPRGSVTLRGVDDGVVIADAFKLGGGLHPEGGFPWWQMAAASFVPFSGAPSDVTSRGDVTIRPAYVEYVGADAYISIHGNASGVEGGSSANGLSSYRYSCSTYADHSNSDQAVNCDDPPGSRALTDAVHAGALESIRARWDVNYRDVGKRVANFGELRVLDDTPGVIIESGFFDNITAPRGDPPPRYPDNRSMHDPRWREAFAMGVAAGIARYFNPAAGAPPDRPEGLSAINQPGGALRVRWSPVEGATAYRLYTATQGRAFDDGVRVEGVEVDLEQLEPRRAYAFRVAAINANGEGYPSQAVAARVRGARVTGGVPPASALLVYAYDRRDAWVQDEDNDLCYATEHGRAFGALEGDLFFDGAQDERVEQGAVDLGEYAFVDLAVGKDSTADYAVSPAMRGLLTTYLAGGGALLVSGEEIGWQMVERSEDPAEEAFLRDVFKAEFVADDAESYTMEAVAGGPFAGAGPFTLDDGTGGVFEVRYPDVFNPVGDGAAGLAWPTGGAAAVVSPQVILLGAPLEAVVPDEGRADLMAAAVAHLLGDLPVGDLDGDGAPDACEERYGMNPRDGADGASDVDGDGFTAAEECAMGTDPGAPDADAGVLPDAGAPEDAAVVDPDEGVVVVDAGITPDRGLTPDRGVGPNPTPDAYTPLLDSGAPPPLRDDVGVAPSPDGGAVEGGSSDGESCNCDMTSRAPSPLWLLLLLWPLRRRRGR